MYRSFYDIFTVLSFSLGLDAGMRNVGNEIIP